MTQEELENKYLKIPQEIKQTRRWVCYKVELRDGKETKTPINAISGFYAKSNEPSTWTTFKVAILGCIKYNCQGIGFMLGNGYFGIDLDNHGDAPENFEEITNEFINTLDSYTEYSHSGKGIHIICKGNLPVGARRKDCIEMYDSGRFFTMTGNVINPVEIEERTEQIKPLWEKYLNIRKENEQFEYKPAFTANGINFGPNVVAETVEISHTNMTDSELIEKIRSSQYGPEFMSLFHGEMGNYGDDHSRADMALCKILAFWTGCNAVQMDRIFRSSGLMRDKWDQKRNGTNRNGTPLSAGTYGSQAIELAISSQREVYRPAKEKVTVIKESRPVESPTEIVQFDERNDPIINVKKIFKSYPLNDTGNAERFYDYFGDSFKFNKDNGFFMFWNGKTWVKDVKECVRKYANKLIDILKADSDNTRRKLEEETLDEDETKNCEMLLKAQLDNIKRVSNKVGKDAMLSELKSLHDLPVVNSEFDIQENLLNTDSGVVDLLTGEIKPFDKKYMLSKNTNCKVDFGEPTVWLKFLNDIFERGNPKETQELIDTVQMALGESLTGRTNKEHLYIMYGTGSNGKSTFVKVVNDVFGDYGTSMNSEMLIQNPNASSQSNEFSMSALLGSRLVSTSETAEGKKLDEVTIKRMLSGEKINAQFKYGQPFAFMPTFSPWMSTNNRPIIRATDFGTWRRIFYIPFENTFTDAKKDVDMPKKLAAESAKILGWMIEGAVKLHTQYSDKLPKPQCLEVALANYKKELDVICAFINDRCLDVADGEVEATKLYQTYKDWAKNGGEYCYAESKFKIELPKKGYRLKKNPNKGWVYVGLVLAERHEGFYFGE